MPSPEKVPAPGPQGRSSPPFVPPTAPSGTFHCHQFHCTLSVAACLARQNLRRIVGPRGLTAPVHRPCGEGTCEQGKLVRLSLPREKKAHPEARRKAIAESVRAALQRKREKGGRLCVGGCGRLLRVDSRGEACFRCRRRAGWKVRAGHLPAGDRKSFSS